MRQLQMANGSAIISYNLWVLRQYFPTFPCTSLYTGSLHFGVAQIPDIVEVEKGSHEIRAPGKLRGTGLYVRRTVQWL